MHILGVWPSIESRLCIILGNGPTAQDMSATAGRRLKG